MSNYKSIVIIRKNFIEGDLLEKSKISNSEESYSLVRNLSFMGTIASRQHVMLVPSTFLLSILQAMMPLIVIFLTKTTLDNLSKPSQDVQGIICFVSFIILLLWLLRIIVNALEKWISMIANRNRHYLLQMIENKVLTMDYINLENPEVQRARRRAIQAINSNLSGGEAIFTNLGLLLQHFIGLLFYSLFITSLNSVVFFALASSTLFITFLTHNVQEWDRTNKKQESKYEQRLNYARERLIKYEMAKDIRLFSLSNWFTEYMHENTDVVLKMKREIVTKYLQVEVISDVLGLIRDGIAYVYLIQQVLRGSLTAGEFTFYLACIAGFSNWLGFLGKDITLINKSNIEIGYLRSFLNIADNNSVQEKISLILEDSKPLEIRFSNVSYRYPNSNHWIINNFNLTIHPGEKLSIVGLNGAGKSTFVKLLCGLYPPTNGKILVNEIDISRIAKEDYFDLFSAVFQENRILAFDIQQNVALRTRENIDQKKVKMSLSKSGLLQTVESLDKGLNTPLSRLFDSEGIVLSGGQQQKLLLARALYKDAPIVVLDEPTAAMDPLAEAELYSQFNQLVKGKTAIFISHRLASTRFCDRIILLKDGEIKESGSHEELLSQNGEYARLFHIQAKNYAQSSVEVFQC